MQTLRRTHSGVGFTVPDICVQIAFLLAPVSVLFVVFISLIELLVGVIQAFIFTVLTALFIGTKPLKNMANINLKQHCFYIYKLN